MPDYQQGKIYTIRCRTDDTLIYVGSTIQPLSVRIGSHKIMSKMEKNQNILLYRTVNNNWDDWFIELYEEFPCENKEQLCKKEGEVIRLIGTLNSQIAGRTDKEYYENNKLKLLEQMKEYYINNKDKILEYQKQYKQEKITCECGCVSTKHNLTKHKKSQKHLNAINTS